MSERYRLLIEAGPSSTPAITRLRAALKCLLRSYGLKCVEAKQTTALDDAQTSTEASDEIEV